MSKISAYEVQIGNFSLGEEMSEADEEGNVSSGAPNPARITWSKENIIKIHEIPWPKHKTSRTSQETLWKLDLEFNIVTSDNLKSARMLVDGVGPYLVKTAFHTTYMYIQSASFNQQAGFNDYYQTCSMKLVEMND